MWGTIYLSHVPACLFTYVCVLSSSVLLYSAFCGNCSVAVLLTLLTFYVQVCYALLDALWVCEVRPPPHWVTQHSNVLCFHTPKQIAFAHPLLEPKTTFNNPVAGGSVCQRLNIANSSKGRCFRNVLPHSGAHCAHHPLVPPADIRIVHQIPAPSCRPLSKQA